MTGTECFSSAPLSKPFGDIADSLASAVGALVDSPLRNANAIVCGSHRR